jgi:hypothetical protein
MKHRSATVQRLYKNGSGEVLRTDTIVISGHIVRRNAWVLGERPVKINSTGHTVHDYGEEVFHPSGPLRVDQEIFQVTTSRTVSEVEMIGGWDTLGAGPDFKSFTWQYGTVDLNFLPGTGDTV